VQLKYVKSRDVCYVFGKGKISLSNGRSVIPAYKKGDKTLLIIEACHHHLIEFVTFIVL
jgi:hypothetical protein